MNSESVKMPLNAELSCHSIYSVDIWLKIVLCSIYQLTLIWVGRWIIGTRWNFIWKHKSVNLINSMTCEKVQLFETQRIYFCRIVREPFLSRRKRQWIINQLFYNVFLTYQLESFFYWNFVRALALNGRKKSPLFYGWSIFLLA